jgi:hypothetical protein
MIHTTDMIITNLNFSHRKRKLDDDHDTKQGLI